MVGRRIKAAEVKNSRNAMRVIRRHAKRKDFTARLGGRKLTKVERRGKYVLLHLDPATCGHPFRDERPVPARERPGGAQPHTHVVVTFQQGGDLRFVDPGRSARCS